MSREPKVLMLRAEDNVANALHPLCVGEEMLVLPEGNRMIATTACPQYHKVALCILPEGSEVIRDGIVIGVTTAPIPAGAHVHIHNLTSRRAKLVPNVTQSEGPRHD